MLFGSPDERILFVIPDPVEENFPAFESLNLPVEIKRLRFWRGLMVCFKRFCIHPSQEHLSLVQPAIFFLAYCHGRSFMSAHDFLPPIE